MPVSFDGTYPYVEALLRKDAAQIETVLDLGAGEGRLGWLTRLVLPDAQITGVEIWRPSCEALRAAGDYTFVIEGDLREVLAGMSRTGASRRCFDLVLAGDVMEHLEEREASAALEHMRYIGGKIVITCPLGPGWEQGTVGGNEWETHRWAPLPSWFFGRGCREAVILDAEARTRYGLHRHLDEWIVGGIIQRAIGTFVFA